MWVAYEFGKACGCGGFWFVRLALLICTPRAPHLPCRTVGRTANLITAEGFLVSYSFEPCSHFLGCCRTVGRTANIITKEGHKIWDVTTAEVGERVCEAQ